MGNCFSNGQSSVNETILSETGQNEQLSDEKVQTSKKGQSTCEKPPSPAEIRKKFQDEFKTAVEEVRSNIVSKICYPNTGGNLQLLCNVLFTYTHTNGLKTAAVVELRNTKSLSGTNHVAMGRLRSSRKTLLEKGYHTVYAYLYINKHTRVSGPLMETAKHEDIKIISKEEMNPDQLAVEIDKKLQLAPGPKRKSGATKSLDEIDFTVSAPAAGKCKNRLSYT